MKNKQPKSKKYKRTALDIDFGYHTEKIIFKYYTTSEKSIKISPIGLTSAFSVLRIASIGFFINIKINNIYLLFTGLNSMMQPKAFLKEYS